MLSVEKQGVQGSRDPYAILADQPRCGVLLPGLEKDLMKMQSRILEVMPLGGVGEFGMNCMYLRCGDDMILIDAGMGFPDESAYGADVSIPNFAVLEEHADKFLAVILTHAHEDHVGGLPYLLKRFNVPVYASHFTAELIESKLEEHNLLNQVLVHRVEPRQTVDLESFTVEFLRASHSLVDCFSLAIKTPVGTIIHTGDYKIDETPVIGEAGDLGALRAYGEEGVLALFADSTNATVPGRTPSERAVIPAFEEIFREAQGRIIVTAFSSSIHRIQIVLDTALRFGRKVCPLGRSMQTNVEIAERTGYLDVSDGLLIGANELNKIDDSEVVLLVTGSQAEPRSALFQMATQSYKGISIQEGDTVVLSSRIIPGNERAISRLIGYIYKRGANIIEEKRRLVHVSGHGSQGDIKIMVETVKPKYVIPIHGEYMMLFRHKEYVKNHLGYPEENILLVENGDVIELEPNHVAITGKREVGRVFVDESGFGEIDRETIRERKQLAYEGVVTIVVAINEHTGKLEAPPQISVRGLAGADSSNGFLRNAEQVIIGAVSSATSAEKKDSTLLKEHLRLELKRFIQKQTGARPVILTTVIQI